MKATLTSDFLLPRIERQAGRSGTPPLNLQLYRLIRKAILSGIFEPGLHLASSRDLAKELGVSRNTVTYAYEQLLAEGYLETRSGVGTFVADTVPDQITPQASKSRPPSSASHMLAERSAGLVSRARNSYSKWGAFRTGTPDVTEFPKNIWMRLQNKVWYRSNIDLLTYAPRGGYMPLREAVAGYLKISRSVNCDPDQVIITSGTQQSIDLVMKLLGRNGDIVWTEDPVYWGLSSLLSTFDIHRVPVPVDDEGLQVQAQGSKPPRFIFVTPSHQYPLGMVMSLSRRRDLLRYAAENRSWIVEDDYDSEFRYGKRPLVSLQGMDEHGSVIYMGTFSKTLFPALRIGFLVVPKALAEPFAIGLSELYRGGQVLNQAVLTEFMCRGHFGSHVRRMRILYSERLNVLHAAIRKQFGDDASVIDGEAGLHLTLGLPAYCDDHAISEEAAVEGIMSRPLSSYYADPVNGRRGLLLGYGCVPVEQIEPAFDRLARIIEQHLYARFQHPPQSDHNWNTRVG